MSVPVWDPLVRIGHWALVGAVALAWATTFAPVVGAWHVRVGYAALAIVAVRIVWGVVGPPHARFARFVRSPRATWAYARLAMRGRAARHLGHNPLGGWMVIAFFACIGALALTGWLYTTDALWGDATVESVHVALAWAMVVLAVVHVAGVVATGRAHGESLVAAMLHGRKRAPSGDDVA